MILEILRKYAGEVLNTLGIFKNILGAYQLSKSIDILFALSVITRKSWRIDHRIIFLHPNHNKTYVLHFFVIRQKFHT